MTAMRLGAAAACLVAVQLAQATPQQEQQLHRLLSRYHALGQLDGAVLVAERGKVVYQRAFGLASREWQQPNTIDTGYRIASLSKQFTAALVLKLVEQGKLRLDDRIGKYVPDLAPEIGNAVTLHQLLNHTSGIVDYANFPGFWNGRLGSVVPRADFMAIMNRPLEFTPGSAGRYNSSGYNLLGYAIEKVTGKPFGTVLDELILAPLGMKRSSYEAPDSIVARRATGYARVLGRYEPAANLHTANVFSSGGMVSTVGDMLKWDQALYGHRLLSPESLRLMFTPYVKDDVWGDLGFGYGWMIGRRMIAGQARLVHEHGGNTNGFRTLITRYPEEQRLVLLLLNEGNGQKRRGIYDVRTAITNVLYQQPVTLPQRSLADAIIDSMREKGSAQTAARLPALRAAHPVPTDPEALNQAAYQYAGKGRYDSAAAVLQMNLLLFPEHANSHDSLGDISRMTGDMQGALRHYRRALELDPANSYAADFIKQQEANK